MSTTLQNFFSSIRGVLSSRSMSNVGKPTEGDNSIVTLESLQPWSENFVKNQNRIKAENFGSGTDEKVFPIDEEINSKVFLFKGDITKLQIDGIVNAANTSLLGGSGVDGCIHDAAGPNLLNECETLNGCEEGSAKITGGHDLPAKHIIHAVGPVGEVPSVLKSAYEKCYELMLENQLKTIAFPCVSTGIYGYPPDQAAHVALLTSRHFLEEQKSKVEGVIFVTFLESDLKIYERLMPRYFPVRYSSKL